MNKITGKSQTVPTGRRGFWRRLLALGAAALGGSFLPARAQPAEPEPRTIKTGNKEMTFDAQGRLIRTVEYHDPDSYVTTYECRDQ